MGQRLNLEIAENGKTLANAYYHWSGYTTSSLEVTQFILDNIDNISYENRVINAVKLLETTGAGLTDEEMEYIKKNIPEAEEIPFDKAVSRNAGLTAVSEKGIEETRNWEEARVTVDLAAKTVNFQALFKYDSKEEYEEVCESTCKYPVHEKIDFSNIPFNKFHEVSEFIIGLVKKGIYGFQTPEGEIWGFIE